MRNILRIPYIFTAVTIFYYDYSFLQRIINNLSFRFEFSDLTPVMLFGILSIILNLLFSGLLFLYIWRTTCLDKYIHISTVLVALCSLITNLVASHILNAPNFVFYFFTGLGIFATTASFIYFLIKKKKYYPNIDALLKPQPLFRAILLITFVYSIFYVFSLMFGPWQSWVMLQLPPIMSLIFLFASYKYQFNLLKINLTDYLVKIVLPIFICSIFISKVSLFFTIILLHFDVGGPIKYDTLMQILTFPASFLLIALLITSIINQFNRNK